MSVHALVAVDGHFPLSLEGAEEHAVAVVRRGDGLFLLHPGAVERAALRVGHALCVVLIDPAGPEHAQPSGRRAEEPGAVGHLVEGLHAVFPLAAPGAVAGAEEHLAFAHAAAQVGLQLDLLYGAVPVFQPLAAIDHIGLAVEVHPQRAVEGGGVGRQIGLVLHGHIGAVWAVAHEHVAGAPLDAVAPHRADEHVAVGEGGEVVVFALVVMQLCGPYHRAGAHPRGGVDLDHVVGSGPHLQVGALPQQSARAGHVVHLGGAVGQDAGVAQTDLFEGHGAHLALC